ncbi:hypothetical protein [Calothrix sp. CCY 0018]|uniref:hypothetical protein n=1 Tax=Calothrix sp. CCY 0018 TaxID=3103864 RepID=UPI0039C617EE
MKYTLLYNPELAGVLRELGIPHPGEAALFLSQLSYWLKKEGCGHITLDGKHWIYNTYKKWVSQIKSLTTGQFGKMIRALLTFGLIEKTTFAEQRHNLKGEKPVGFSSWNNTTWVTLCVEKIIQLTGWCPFENETAEEAQEEKPGSNNSESVETALGADVHIRTSGDSKSNDRIFHLESPSIYKENLSFTKNGENYFKKEKNIVANTDSGSDPASPTDKKQLPEKPKISKVDKSRQNSEVREKRINEKDKYPLSSSIREKRTIEQDAVQEVWEIAIGKPFPVFLNWRANIHYKPQGGKWESDAYGNAYSEFYRNREKTTAVLFPQFMNEVRGITEKVHNAQSSNAIAANTLPSWFIESLPDATPENVKQLMENLDAVIRRGTRIALPSKSNTPSDITVDYHEAHSEVAIKPLPQLDNPVLKGVEAPLELNGVEAPSSALQQTLARKQAQWNAPLLRDRIRSWAESTPGVVITESGPQLETAIETTLNNTAIDKVETNCNNTAIDKIETTRLKVETSNPIVEKQNHGARGKADVETHNPSNSNSRDVVIDDPWETEEPLSSNTNSVSEGNSSTERLPPLIKLMLAVWDNIYELGQLVLDARSEDLIKAVSSLSSHQIAHIKQAATRAWYPGLNRDGDYKGERVEIWEVGQSPTVKVRTKRGAFLKVRRSDLKPWLGI